ncbi:hypothetical protein [Prosthecochloris marina]|nr:hypothetical protein [Prosthecochloris marina]
MRSRKAGMYALCGAVLLFIFFGQGCTRSEQPVLSEADRKFAAFYADYLVLSGVTVSESENVSLIGGKHIDSLFEIHALTFEGFNERTDVYKENPKLWRAVLLQVRNNLQQDDR